jgi:hypothetical protein
MTASRGVRAPRADRGRVDITPRDLAALTFAAEQYALPVELWSRVLGAPERVGRRRAAVLERAGYVQRQRLLNRAWVVPTPAGLRFAGLPYSPWAPAGWKLAHTEAVARLRLHLERAHAGVRWESERAIRHYWSVPERKLARVRVADGALELADGRRIGVELELSRKAMHRYGPAVADSDPRVAEVWWFTPDPEWLQRVLAEIPAPCPQVVLPLPEGVAS